MILLFLSVLTCKVTLASGGKFLSDFHGYAAETGNFTPPVPRPLRSSVPHPSRSLTSVIHSLIEGISTCLRDFLRSVTALH